MLVKVIGALFIIGFFVVLNKVGSALLGPNNNLSKFFPIGSTLIGGFFISLIFFG